MTGNRSHFAPRGSDRTRRAASAASAVVLVALATCGSAAGGGAQPPVPPASCMGFLANASNPNASATIGTNGGAGSMIAGLAQAHNGTLQACIP